MLENESLSTIIFVVLIPKVKNCKETRTILWKNRQGDGKYIENKNISEIRKSIKPCNNMVHIFVYTFTKNKYIFQFYKFSDVLFFNFLCCKNETFVTNLVIKEQKVLHLEIYITHIKVVFYYIMKHRQKKLLKQ